MAAAFEYRALKGRERRVFMYPDDEFLQPPRGATMIADGRVWVCRGPWRGTLLQRLLRALGGRR